MTMDDDQQSGAERPRGRVPGGGWLLTGSVAVVAAVVTGVLVWLASFAPPPATQRAAAVTVTATVTVTGAAPAPVSTAGASPSTSRPAEWVVRTPAGMSCLLRDSTVTCAGGFDAAVEGYRWTVGESVAEAVLGEPVSFPVAGTELSYGVVRAAGPWVLKMNRDGLVIEQSGGSVRVSRAGMSVV